MIDRVDPSPGSAESQAESSASTGSGRLLLLLLVAALVGIGVFLLRDELTLSRLAEREAQFREFERQHPVFVHAAAFTVYVIVTGLSLPGATAMTLLIGWLLGFWRGAIVVSFASTSGATVAFLLSRYLLRESIQSRFGDRLRNFNAALEREGAFYLFTLRLIPAVPFFVINVVMGLTRIPVRTYWWVSQLGMLPATCIYVYAGSTVPELETLAERGTSGILTPQLFVAFTVLGLFPLAARRVLHRLRPPSA